MSPLVKGSLTALAVSGALMLSSCSSDTASDTASNTANPTTECSVAPTQVVVTTNVWASIVDQLGGPCAEVSTVITSGAADPHDFEPTAATSADFSASKLAVINGLGYDSWATKIVNSLGDSAPPVLNIGESIGLKAGDNPHIWYSPTYVQEAATSITASLKKALPAASAQFDSQASSFTSALEPYLAEVASIKTQYQGTNVGATETVFTYMADATGLNLTTPSGFLKAIANDSDASTQDVAKFRQQLSDGTDKVLIFNAQTDGGLPQQMKQVAEANNVPIVRVTETLVPDNATFQDWQVAQLKELGAALAKG
jgi:zinc/manganese transport system substrate-binding protein